ncbi:MAG: proline--tRNA ligase, partial [Pelosinus sp.]|nr:proline--tRNA ligase [Pelosinus sp.]
QASRYSRQSAAIEQNNDEHGIVWPVALAPYHAVVVPISIKDEAQKELAEKVYAALNSIGVEVVLDDRNERPGVKFKDADLIGYPLKITIGPKAVNEDSIEVKVRKTAEVFYFSQADYQEKVKELLENLQ